MPPILMMKILKVTNRITLKLKLNLHKFLCCKLKTVKVCLPLNQQHLLISRTFRCLNLNKNSNQWASFCFLSITSNPHSFNRLHRLVIARLFSRCLITMLIMNHMLWFPVTMQSIMTSETSFNVWVLYV